RAGPGAAGRGAVGGASGRGGGPGAAGPGAVSGAGGPGGVTDPWDIPGGWRIGEPAWAVWRIETPGREPVEVRVRGTAAAAEVRVADGPVVPAGARWDGAALLVSYAGRTCRDAPARAGGVLWLGRDGHTSAPAHA